jgi:thymidylate synthase
MNQRVRSWNGRSGVIDQLDYVVDLLRMNPKSRKAVISLWNPEDDVGSSEPSCPITFQALARPSPEGLRLSGMTVVRSSDVWNGMPVDLLYFGRLMSTLADDLGMLVGQYTHIVSSLHMYLHSVPSAARIARS